MSKSLIPIVLMASGTVASSSMTTKDVVSNACPASGTRVVSAIRTLGRVPYRLTSVDRPRRTIILIHGGPDTPALEAPDELDCYLATRFSARVIKPAYFGSSERSPWANVPQMDLTTPLNREQLAARLLRSIDVAYGGMPRSVEEIRAFVDHWDGARTTVVGESHGAVLAALAARRSQRSPIVLVAPVIASRRAIVRAARTGRYTLREPIDPPRLVLNGVDVTDRVFVSHAEREHLLEAVSLAYYRPWQDRTLAGILSKSPVRAKVLVGLRDRVGMIGSEDWSRLRSAVPPGTELCADPRLGHEPPMASPAARRCFERFMRQGPASASHARVARR